MMTIKPCPWCGSSGTLEQRSLAGPRGTGYTGCFAYFVHCVSCGAVAPDGMKYDLDQMPEEAVEEAIDAWNRRSDRKCT